ncbi:MAG: hypothetical protein IJ087_04070 [Eggerthellaceae bacterium]|nr:hypothetical protein [Eggerthellaceae bacterium]
MVQGIDSREKRYVKVVSSTDEDGLVMPLSIEWEDGRVYEIDQVLDRRRAASLKVGGTGVRYLIRIGNAKTYLFHEDPRWYVEAKRV